MPWLLMTWWQNNSRHYMIKPDSKVRGANMGPIWGRQDPGWPHELCFLGKYRCKSLGIYIQYINHSLQCQWARWHLKSPASQLFTQPFIQTQIRENIKAPCHWPLCGNSPVTGEFSTQRASNAENISLWWCHPVTRTVRDCMICPFGRINECLVTCASTENLK